MDQVTFKRASYTVTPESHFLNQARLEERYVPEWSGKNIKICFAIQAFLKNPSFQVWNSSVLYFNQSQVKYIFSDKELTTKPTSWSCVNLPFLLATHVNKINKERRKERNMKWIQEAKTKRNCLEISVLTWNLRQYEWMFLLFAHASHPGLH